MAKGSIFGAAASGARLERMLASPRYVDGAFRNTAPVSPGVKPGSGLATLREYLAGRQQRTPPAPLPSMDPLPLWARRADTDLRATWLGHSTVLLEIDGYRVLTDPVWAQRASPSSLAGPRRFQPVPVPLAAVPPLDAVVISHDHYDHLDRDTVAALSREHPMALFFTSLGVGAHLEAWGVPPGRIVELDWWESAALAGAELRITAAPAQHFSGRGLRDRNATLWSGFAVRGPRHAVFFGGDSGFTPEYADVRERLGPFDLTMLEIGAWHPAWGDIHLGPVNALRAACLLGSAPLLPIHWGTFALAMHAWDEPIETLLREAPAQGVSLVVPLLGAAVEPARVERVQPWWRRASAAEADRLVVRAGSPATD